MQARRRIAFVAARGEWSSLSLSFEALRELSGRCWRKRPGSRCLDEIGEMERSSSKVRLSIQRERLATLIFGLGNLAPASSECLMALVERSMALEVRLRRFSEEVLAMELLTEELTGVEALAVLDRGRQFGSSLP